MALSQISLEAVMNALRTVKDPETGPAGGPGGTPGGAKDIVALDRIRDLQIGSDGVISLRVVLTPAISSQKEKIQAQVESALMAVSGVTKAKVTTTLDAQVKGGPARSSQIEGVKHIIAVSSGKGGVGKSTVAVNLATALALGGARVGLMDADVYGPNVPTMMGVTEQPQLIQDPIHGESFIPPTAYGVKVMSMGFLIAGDQPLVWRGPMLHSVVNQFCHKVQWGTLDYLIVDMPPGTGDVQLSLAQLVPVSGAVLVSTPQEVSMQDVRKAYHMFEKVRVPVLGFVENMSYFECDSCSKKHYLFGQGGGRQLARKFGVDLLAELPMVPGVREGGDEGRPVVVRSPDSAVAKSFRELAETLARKVAALAEAGAPDPAQAVRIGKF